jgi:hypothetical protein
MLVLLIILGVSWIPALVGHGVVQSVAALFPLATSTQPYFHPELGWLLYLWTPVVVASACVLFLSPGVILSIALNSAKNIGQWVLTAFALSIILVSVLAGIIQSIIKSPLRDLSFALTVVFLSTACFGFLLARYYSGQSLEWPFGQPYTWTTLLSMMVVPSIILITLLPKFFWENFNGDGAHAFESARLLFVQPLPFWPASTGNIASFPGVTSVLFVYPVSWFIRLFGPVEASARLPFLLELVALYAALITLVEYGRTRLLRATERWLIWLELTVFVVVVAYSATYSPYSADIALPATQDTLMMVCFLGFILAFLKREMIWMYLFIGFTYLTLPNGVQLIGFWLLSIILIWKPRPWREAAEVAVALLACFILSVISPSILNLIHLPAPGQEYGFLELMRHFAWLQWADWHRLAYLVIPCGILPAFGLLATRLQDQMSQALALLIVAYFIFFYISARIVLHYFVPVMILPLVIFWHNAEWTHERYRPYALGAVFATAMLALYISLPSDKALDTSARQVGLTMEDRIGGYESLDPAVFQRSKLLFHLFPVDWDPRVPSESYGGSSLSWNYYMHQAKENHSEINYVIQLAGIPAPEGMRLVAQEGRAALYMRSDEVWQKQIALRPPTPAGSPVYAIPRGIIFNSVPLNDGPTIINMVEVLDGLGLDINSILGKFDNKN